MHPIIKELSNSNTSILEIVEKYYQKDQLLENTLLKLIKDLGKGQLGSVFFEEIDQAIISGHPDSELFILFVLYAINYFILIKYYKNANTLASIASSLLTKENNATVQTLYCQTFARLKYDENNQTECRKYLIKLMSLMKEGQPRYNQYKLNCMNILGGMGQLNEMGVFNEIVPPSFTTKDEIISYFVAIFLNCGKNGDYLLGLKAIKYFKINFPVVMKSELAKSEAFFKVMSGDFNENNHSDILFKQYVKVCLNLSNGNFEVAHDHLKILLNETKNPNHYFIENFPLHFELSTKNIGKAKFILYEREQKGISNFMDGLYYGRLQLLEKKYLEADQSFIGLTENVKKYGAMNLLKFELNFAKEMRLFDQLRLINGWGESSVGIPIKASKKKEVIKGKINNGVDLLIGQTEKMVTIKNQIKKYSKLKDIVLITGETGTGKELVAKAIHEEGLHPKEPFLAINCGALTDTLLQSELFGYVTGAFTGAMKERKGIFESAGKGTVFLDEFGDISPKMQISLLRVLESNEIRLLGDTVNRYVQCKIVIATNVDLHKAVEENKFREDLFFRLARFELKLPSLRERIDDLSLLIQFFLDRNTGIDENRKIISINLLNELTTYHWPGNIRELKNEIDRLSILNPEVKMLDVEHFDFTHLQGFQRKIINKPQQVINEDTLPDIAKNEHHAQIIENGFRKEKRFDLIKDLFRKYKKLTRKQIVEFTKTGQSTATNDLQMLCKAGFLVRKSPTKSPSTHYYEFNEFKNN